MTAQNNVQIFHISLKDNSVIQYFPTGLLVKQLVVFLLLIKGNSAETVDIDLSR